ncbi:UNVERIFIED_CONTAM: hypothetical protein K2H54_023844 [Gekko kuhli]
MGWHQLLAAGCTVFALTTLVLVVTSHRWVLVESTKQTYTSGIWKICTKMVCASIHAREAYFDVIRFLFVLALFCMFFCSSYMLFTYRYLPTFRLSRFLFSAIGCFITGFLMLMATTIYTVFIVRRGISRAAQVTYLPTFYLAWCIGPIFAVSGEKDNGDVCLPCTRFPVSDGTLLHAGPPDQLNRPGQLKQIFQHGFESDLNGELSL